MNYYVSSNEMHKATAAKVCCFFDVYQLSSIYNISSDLIRQLQDRLMGVRAM
jgi:hypothetical protein